MKKKNGVKYSMRESDIIERIKEICLIPKLEQKDLPKYYNKVLNIL